MQDGIFEIIGQMTFRVSGEIGLTTSCQVHNSCGLQSEFSMSARVNIDNFPVTRNIREFRFFPKWMRKKLFAVNIAENVGSASGTLFRFQKEIKALVSLKADSVCQAGHEASQ